MLHVYSHGIIGLQHKWTCDELYDPRQFHLWRRVVSYVRIKRSEGAYCLRLHVNHPEEGDRIFFRNVVSYLSYHAISRYQSYTCCPNARSGSTVFREVFGSDLDWDTACPNRSFVCGLLQSLLENSGIEPRSGHDHILSNPNQFMYHPVI